MNAAERTAESLSRGLSLDVSRADEKPALSLSPAQDRRRLNPHLGEN